MSKRTLMTAAAVVGLALTGCEKEPDNGELAPVGQEQQGLAEQPQPAAQQQQPAEQQQPGEAEEDLQVLSAVTVIGIEEGCPATDLYFPTDSSELGDDDRAVLDQLAACLQGTPEAKKIEITATADPRGPEPYNRKLSEERAKAVAEYLQKQGVKEDRFEIRARGEKGVVEGMPALWPLQREATVEPVMP